MTAFGSKEDLDERNCEKMRQLQRGHLSVNVVQWESATCRRPDIESPGFELHFSYTSFYFIKRRQEEWKYFNSILSIKYFLSIYHSTQIYKNKLNIYIICE